MVYHDGREQSGTVLWHRQQDLILMFDEQGLHSFRPSQARQLILTDARFGTERNFITSKDLSIENVRGLAELVGSCEDLAVVSVNPGIYLAPGSLSEVRTALESSSTPQAYTLEDGPQYRRSLFRIFRSFCKHHGPASAASTETLYLVDNSGHQKARKITLGYAVRQALRHKERRPLLRAVLAREGSRTRTEGVDRFLAALNQEGRETAVIAIR